MNPKNTSWQAGRFAIIAVFLGIGLLARLQADQPQWGDARTHNLVSNETGLPDHFETSPSGNLRWSIEMGNSSYATPVGADGKVYVGNKRGTVFVFQAGREKNLLSETQFETGLYGSPVAAAGTLYLSTFDRFFAFGR